ncbi:MAG TPA: multicopper oxidase domain-containing protein, partial [Nocardioidaceae bacterium]|nr:multicopper oxidase domain-containing protein [Nocardioidaceae bacterium]
TVALALAHRARWAAQAGGRPAVVALLLLALGVAATGRAAASTDEKAHPMSMSTGSDYWQRVGGDEGGGGVVRRYYVSADPVVWNYAPGGVNVVTAKPFDKDDAAGVFVGRGPGRIGPRYVKCLYRAYTDASFRHRVARPAEEAYLGMLGPVIRAEVGDTIKVVYRNTCPFPTSMHPHGVFYTKSSEGAPYSDGTRGGAKRDDAVPTGHRHTYVWEVPGRAGPGPGDGSSVMWMYHSHTDEVADTYAGLVGPMVVTARGQARPDGSPRDVDRELFMSFFIDNETLSPLLRTNIRRFGTPPMPVRPEDDPELGEHNLKHSINGYLYGTMPMVTVQRGQHVRWYVMAMGTEVDLHTPHWHGNDVVIGGMRMDVASLLPAGMLTADMVPDNPGTWLFHCHVNDHIVAGMLTRYRVT